MINTFIDEYNAVVSLHADISKIPDIHKYLNNLDLFVQKKHKYEKETEYIESTKISLAEFNQRKDQLDPKNISDNSVEEWVSASIRFVNSHVPEIDAFTEIKNTYKQEVIADLKKLQSDANEYKRINDKELQYEAAKDEIAWCKSFASDANKILLSKAIIGHKLIVSKDIFVKTDDHVNVNEYYTSTLEDYSKNNKVAAFFKSIKILTSGKSLIINKTSANSKSAYEWLNNFYNYIIQTEETLNHKTKLPEEYKDLASKKISELKTYYRETKNQRDSAADKAENHKNSILNILLKVAVPLLWSLPIIALFVGVYFFMAGSWTQVAPQWLMRHDIPWYVFMWWGKGGDLYFLYAAPAFLIEALVWLIGNLVLAIWFLFSRLVGIIFYVLYFLLPIIASIFGGFIMWSISSEATCGSEFDLDSDGAKMAIFVGILVVSVIVLYICLGTVGSLGQLVKWR